MKGCYPRFILIKMITVIYLIPSVASTENQQGVPSAMTPLLEAQNIACKPIIGANKAHIELVPRYFEYPPNIPGIHRHFLCLPVFSTLEQATMNATLPPATNILKMTCVNLNPIYDPSSSASYAAILNGVDDLKSSVTFPRLVDLDSGVRTSTYCRHGDNQRDCLLPHGSVINSSRSVIFPDSAPDKFGVYGCRGVRYRTTVITTIFMSNDAQFQPEHFTVTLSLDEEVTLKMNNRTTGGSGSLVWRLNHVGGGQTDLSSSVSGDSLIISRANKEAHAGIHHYFYSDEPDKGGLVRLIVRDCLDNLWGSDCQYTCPTCYNGGVCDDVTGRCVCPPGFSGDHCQSACGDGKFGHDCTGSCSALESGRSDCSGAVFCLPDPYGCSCAPGWTGLACDQACSTDSYGAGCKQTCHCESSGSCDSTTGGCSNGCETGWTGDQCQVTVLDTVGALRQGGIDDTGESNFLGIFLIGDPSMNEDSSLKYYIGREVDTGPGETGHGVTAAPGDSDLTQSWLETGLPEGSTFLLHTPTSQQSLRVYINNTSGGDARVGAFRMSVYYRGWTERTVMLNEYRGDDTSEVWPEKLSITTGTGEKITIRVLTAGGINTTSLRWRHNGGNEIREWDGLVSVTIEEARKSDEGIYECYVNGNREQGKHAILRLFVRGCPSSKYGLDCSQDCPVCYAGGVCHDVTGECVCRPGFKGNQCQIPCSNNQWGRDCADKCRTGGNCVNRLFSSPDPVGLSCINGFTGNRCQTACDSSHFGADCEFECHCTNGDSCTHTSVCSAQLCTDKYEGIYCQALKSNLDCPSGYFGTLCNYPCHCHGDQPCRRPDGQCLNGVHCADGWTGTDCQQALPRLLESLWVTSVNTEHVLLAWNDWADGYDLGNGPVHSYQIDYTWTNGTTGHSGEPTIITGDSTAYINGLSANTEYNFYISARRNVGGQVVAGLRSVPVKARTHST